MSGVWSGGSNCQFSLFFDNELREMEENEHQQIMELTGKSICSQVLISAGCNKNEDHKTLGILTLWITWILDGLVDYKGDLSIYNEGLQESIDGKLYLIKYNSGKSTSMVSNSEFLSNWIKDPGFRMVK